MLPAANVWLLHSSSIKSVTSDKVLPADVQYFTTCCIICLASEVMGQSMQTESTETGQQGSIFDPDILTSSHGAAARGKRDDDEGRAGISRCERDGPKACHSLIDGRTPKETLNNQPIMHHMHTASVA